MQIGSIGSMDGREHELASRHAVPVMLVLISVNLLT
jgi:hypothetical protein